MIFCVEDDSGIRDLMIYTLNAAGFEAVGFGDDAAFWEAMKQQRPELILLDIMLPGEDGISILKSLRSQIVTKDIPVIMATAKGTEYDKVTGLDLGADDDGNGVKSQGGFAPHRSEGRTGASAHRRTGA